MRKSKPVFKLTPLDVWGDEGVWEKVVDFTKIKKRRCFAGRCFIQSIIDLMDKISNF